tara:strand:+ start:1204 stop:1575 length:372 start_codon:yes stop_codon:yes gene_type:complete
MEEIKLEYDDYTDCQDLAFHDIPEIAWNYKINKSTLDSKFEQTDNIEDGTRIVYFKGEKPVHYGLCTNRGTVISKIGISGPIFEHDYNNLSSKYEYDSITLYNIPLKEEFNVELKEIIKKPLE